VVILKDLGVRKCWCPFCEFEDMRAFLSDRDAVWDPVGGDLGERVSFSTVFLAFVVFVFSKMPPATMFLWDLKFGDYFLLVTIVLKRVVHCLPSFSSCSILQLRKAFSYADSPSEKYGSRPRMCLTFGLDRCWAFISFAC
jgi:hypothetical protein